MTSKNKVITSSDAGFTDALADLITAGRGYSTGSDTTGEMSQGSSASANNVIRSGDPGFSEALDALIAENQAKVINTRSLANMNRQQPSNAQEMLSIFQQAFPDMDHEITVDSANQRGVRSRTRPKASTAVVGKAVPEGYNPKIAEQGIADFKTALENATTDEERFTIATRLNTLVQTQKAFKFGEYKKRAEAEFSVPELEAAIEQVRVAELASPYNPGTGMPSAQRMQLITSLGTARTHAAARVTEYLSHDPTLAAAEALAKGTLAEVQGRMALEGREEALSAKRVQKEARATAIQSMEPGFIEGVALVKWGRIPKDDKEVENIAGQIYDGKLKLNETELFLAKANDDTLKNFFIQNKDPKMRGLTLMILKQREINALGGNEALAQRHVDAFKTIVDKGISDTDPNIPPEIKKRYKDAVSEATANVALSNKTKDELIAERTVAIRRELLATLVKKDLYSSLDTWQGLIKSDEAAQAIIRQNQIAKKRMSLDTFIASYLGYADGRDLPTKNKALRAIIASASQAMPKSVVLPMPSPESIDSEAQAMIARALLNISTSEAWIRLRESVRLPGTETYNKTDAAGNILPAYMPKE